MITATIFDIKRFAVHDGDGIRTTVFFKGCPLSCIWCHNPEGLSATPVLHYNGDKCIGCGECAAVCERGVHRVADGTHTVLRTDCTACGSCVAACTADALRVWGREVTVEELMPTLTEDKSFYAASGGGVTLSGGECTLYTDFLVELMSALRAEGIGCAVDTSGYVSRERLMRIAPLADVFLYDLKAYSSEVHRRLTGVPNELILDNLRYLDSIGARIEIRIPFVPEHNAAEMEPLAAFIATLGTRPAVRLLAYHNHARKKYESLGMPSPLPERMPDEAELAAARAIFTSHGITLR